jgi:predicted DNA-binding transcriptional regulator AlpA
VAELTTTTTAAPCPTMRPAEAAAYLGCSVREVWRVAASDDTFPRPEKLSHRVTVFDRAAVERWHERRRAKARAE